MFAAWLDGCRRNLKKQQSSLLGRLTGRDPLKALGPLEGRFAPSLPHYRLLLEHGRVVWGTIVQANVGLFSPGDDDLPANTLISPDPAFDDNPGALRSYAHRIFDLKGTYPDDPQLDEFAAIVTDEHNYASNEPLPRKLADGYEVYLTSSTIHRACLPQSFLASNIFPMLICPERTFMNLPLPAVFWPQELVDKFGDIDHLAYEPDDLPPNTRRTATTPFPRDPEALPRDVFQTSLLIDVTQRAARTLVEMAAEQGNSQPYFRAAVSSSFHHSLTIEPPDYVPNGNVEMVVPTRGVRLIVAHEEIDRMKGTVIDFRSGAMVSGFMFHNPNAR